MKPHKIKRYLKRHLFVQSRLQVFYDNYYSKGLSFKYIKIYKQ